MTSRQTAMLEWRIDTPQCRKNETPPANALPDYSGFRTRKLEQHSDVNLGKGGVIYRCLEIPVGNCDDLLCFLSVIAFGDSFLVRHAEAINGFSLQRAEGWATYPQQKMAS